MAKSLSEEGTIRAPHASGSIYTDGGRAFQPDKANQGSMFLNNRWLICRQGEVGPVYRLPLARIIYSTRPRAPVSRQPSYDTLTHLLL
jgi:hypothetical protein